MKIHDYIDYWATRAPQDICVYDEEQQVTWSQMRTRTCELGNWLAETVGPGKRFGVLSKNSIEYLVLYFAASRAGAIPVPLNVRLAPREWEYILNDSGADLLLSSAELVDRANEMDPQCASRRHCWDGSSPDWQDLRTGLANYPSREPEHVALAGDPLYQMYTSGTTGSPKGVLLTQSSVTENVAQLQVLFPMHRKKGLIIMPLFHTGAVVTAIMYAANGITTRIVKDFEPESLSRILREEEITTTTLVPAMIQTLVQKIRPRTTFPSLELIAYGSAPIASEVLQRAIKVFDCDFLQVYGMTEVSAGATVLDPEDHRRALAHDRGLLLSAGRPIVGTDLRIVDEHGRCLPVGRVGEVVVRGPQVMSGYWNLPQATHDTLLDGWLHTGDAGYLNKDGYLFICDRVKDMIISGGENVYPSEVEDVLFSLSGIADAAVIGVPDDRWGEVPKAFVVRETDSTLDETTIIAHCRRSLAAFKCPRSVEFVEDFPRNATGKVLKRVLRAPYWSHQERAVN